MIKKIIFSKKEFLFPLKKNILLFDENGSDQINYSKIIKSDYVILNTRYEKINLMILFYSLFKKNKYSNYLYLNTYIEYCDPKIIITYIDTSARLIEIKKNFEKIIYIFIQNGYRQKRWHKSFALIDNKKKIIDYYFVQNENWQNYIKDYFFKQVYTVGSIINNNFKFCGNFKQIKSVKWVSQYRKKAKNNLEPILLKYIKKICLNLNLSLEIILAHKPKYKDEVKFYEDIIGECVLQVDSYNSVNEESLIVGIDSTFLYESFARGFRTAFLTVRSTQKEFDESYNFGWPGKYSKDGNFWTSELDEQKISNIFKYLINISHSEWRNEIANYESIMHYDPDNKIIKKYLSKIIK